MNDVYESLLTSKVLRYVVFTQSSELYGYENVVKMAICLYKHAFSTTRLCILHFA